MRVATRVVGIVEVSRLTGLGVRTLRRYEEEGLIEPALRDGESLVYAEETVERLLRIRRLREELGVNLAGVEVILRMRDELERLRLGITGLAELTKLRAQLKASGGRLLARKLVASGRVRPRSGKR